MDSKQAERLLKRYWQCDTTPEEENRLRDFFCHGEVPAHLLPHKDWFTYLQTQQAVGLGDDFDTRVLAQVEPPKVKARRISLLSRFMPLLKAAAVVAVVVLVGSVMQQSFVPPTEETPPVDTIGKQISTPSVASSNRGLAADKHHPDSLQQTNLQEQVE